jgi:hypothetical protein
VSFIERSLRAGLAGLGLLAGCNASPPPAPAPKPPDGSAAPTPSPAAPAPAPAGVPPASPATASALPLPPPGPVRNWNEVRLQAARRLVAANPSATYTGPAPEPLLGIPVLQIELNGDGSVRRIVVLRHPQEAKDTTKLAEAAVRRAAPFGDVSHLPKPWHFTETFLFNDERKFKPRTLD